MRLAIELTDQDMAMIEPLMNLENSDRLYDEITAIVPQFDEIMQQEIDAIRQKLIVED